MVIGGLFIIFKVETQYAYGIGLALISAFLAAIFSLINGKLVQKAKPSVISFYELGAGVVFLSIYIAITRGFDVRFFQLSSADWVYVFILASVCTAYAFIASVKVMRNLSPYTVMLTTNLEPVYGIILAFFLLGDEEKMRPLFYLGAGIILVTVVANGILKNRFRKHSFKKPGFRYGFCIKFYLCHYRTYFKNIMEYLDLNSPIKELEEQLDKCQIIGEESDVDVTETCKQIEKKLNETRKDIYKNLTAWQRVQLSRHPNRPYTLDYINAICGDTFLELHGDRNVRDDKAMIGGLGKIDDQSYMFIGQQKGFNTKTPSISQFRNGESGRIP